MMFDPLNPPGGAPAPQVAPRRAPQPLSRIVIPVPVMLCLLAVLMVLTITVWVMWP